MAYNPNNPKLSESAYFKSTYFKWFMVKSDARFYGTDKAGNRTSFSNSFSDAMRERILNPENSSYPHPWGDFFKPFPAKTEGFIKCVSEPLQAVLDMGFTLIGIINAALGSSSLLIGIVLNPALSELTIALSSLLQGLYHSARGHHSNAAEYYLDAGTRLALLVPLITLSAISTPLLIPMFFTRSFASFKAWTKANETSVDSDMQADAPQHQYANGL